jgi:MFS_1 like family
MSLELAGHMAAHGRWNLLSFILLYATLYAGFGVMSPFLPSLLQSRGLQPDQIGLVLALSTGVRLVSSPLADRTCSFAARTRLMTDFGFQPGILDYWMLLSDWRGFFAILLALSVLFLGYTSVSNNKIRPDDGPRRD